MAGYVPNIGELEKLKTIVGNCAINIGLYTNAITPDGSTTFANFVQMTVTGGYAPIELNNSIAPTATLDKWRVFTNTAGRAEAVYSTAAQEWVFLNENVSLGETVYGVFGWYNTVRFNQGSIEIKVNDSITIGTATAIVTQVRVETGSWTGGNATGELCLKTVSGTFASGANIQVGGETRAVTASTLDRRLLFVDSLSTPTKVDTFGQKITYLPKIFLSTR